MHAELRQLMEEHAPALAMAIAVDVESGDVLALDSASLYDYSGFAPLLHEFTPGASTFKAIIMALALDAGVTTPDELFPTYRGAGLRLGGRTIREAEGAPTEAEITAAEGSRTRATRSSCRSRCAWRPRSCGTRSCGSATARSQGRPRPRARRLSDAAEARHLAQQPDPRLRRVRPRADGHPLAARGGPRDDAPRGVRRPLRLVRALTRDGRRFEAQLEGGEQVLAPEACRETREMMALGARSGTGDAVAKREMHPEFSWIGTKTGTTEKVPTELCVHLELRGLAEAARDGEKWTQAKRRALFALERPHRRRSCYTSSMCAVARAVDVNGEEREVMVLVVADDATGGEGVGSRVSGPTARAILRQAIDRPSRRRRRRAAAVAGRVRTGAPSTSCWSASRQWRWASVGKNMSLDVDDMGTSRDYRRRIHR